MSGKDCICKSVFNGQSNGILALDYFSELGIYECSTCDTLVFLPYFSDSYDKLIIEFKFNIELVGYSGS